MITSQYYRILSNDVLVLDYLDTFILAQQKLIREGYPAWVIERVSQNEKGKLDIKVALDYTGYTETHE